MGKCTTWKRSDGLDLVNAWELDGVLDLSVAPSTFAKPFATFGHSYARIQFLDPSATGVGAAEVTVRGSINGTDWIDIGSAFSPVGITGLLLVAPFAYIEVLVTTPDLAAADDIEGWAFLC